MDLGSTQAEQPLKWGCLPPVSYTHLDVYKRQLLGGLNKEMYENTYCIPQAGAAPGKELAEFVQNCMANAAGTGDGTLQLNLALAQIHKKRKQAAAQVKQETELRQLSLIHIQMCIRDRYAA